MAMKNESITTLEYGYSTSWDKYGTSSYTGPQDHSSTSSLQGVVTANNQKPFDRTKISPHAYTKLWTANSAYIIQSRGSYNNGGSGQNIMNFGYAYYGQYLPFMGEYNTANVDSRAFEKLLDQARGAHANLAVDLAEARQTLRMVAKAFKVHHLVAEFARVVVKQRGYKKIRKGPTQGQRRLDYVTEKWLEYRYGWMPLLASIYEMGEAARKRRVTNRVYLKARSGQRIDSTIRTGDGSFSNPYKTVVTQGSYRCEYGAVFDLPTGSQFSDWTSLNPLSIAWELVPFSFVADWFIGIGQCMENWENWALYRNHYVVGYKTNTQSERRSFTLSGSSSYAPRYWPNGDTMDGVHSETKFQTAFTHGSALSRQRLNSLPTPGGPRVNVNLNSKRLLDAAGLIHQITRQFR